MALRPLIQNLWKSDMCRPLAYGSQQTWHKWTMMLCRYEERCHGPKHQREMLHLMVSRSTLCSLTLASKLVALSGQMVQHLAKRRTNVLWPRWQWIALAKALRTRFDGHQRIHHL